MTKAPPRDADAWAKVKDKKDLLERSYAEGAAEISSSEQSRSGEIV
jgi:hypothetical protein